MKLSILLFTLTLMLVIYPSPASAEYSYQFVAPPGAESSHTPGINNAGKVVGGVNDGVALFSFMYDMKSGEYTTISDFDEFSVLEISNSGVMVGNVEGVCAIRDKHGNITTFFPPSYTPDSFCQARGVNPVGKVSGYEIDEFDVWTGFIYDPQEDTYEEFLPSLQTVAAAINAKGQIVGSVFLFDDDAYPGSPPGRYAYLREPNGTVKYFAIAQSYPGYSWARGISESGLISGFFLDPDTFEKKGYVTTLSKGTEFENITLTDDQVIHLSPCDPDTPAPGPGYVLLTDLYANQVRNDGVVVGGCNDWHYNETTGDWIEYTFWGFIATPIK